jgi:hypothetical protein
MLRWDRPVLLVNSRVARIQGIYIYSESGERENRTCKQGDPGSVLQPRTTAYSILGGYETKPMGSYLDACFVTMLQCPRSKAASELGARFQCSWDKHKIRAEPSLHQCDSTTVNGDE